MTPESSGEDFNVHLADIVATKKAITLSSIAGFKDLASELQDLMSKFGVLDPPADGQFGPMSRWALDETMKKLGVEDRSVLDSTTAQKFLDAATPETLFPINPADDFAGRITKFMAQKKFWLCRHPDCVNIVYVEGAEPDGKLNDNAPNQFNDVRLVLRVAKATGVPEIVGAWDATTEPGRYYTEHPDDPEARAHGAARIALSQFKAWAVGIHHGSKPENDHEALIQAADITVFRDANRDYNRAGDLPYTGMFGIDQHHGFNLPRSDIQNASAGCLVGRLVSEHQAFMALAKSDARYLANHAYLFITTIIAGSELYQKS